MDMNVEKLNQLEAELHAYGHASACLYFDGATVAPRASAERRGETLSLLSQKRYELMTADATQALLLELAGSVDASDATLKRRVELLQKDISELTRIPMEEYTEYTRICAVAEDKWVQAKQQNNYALFEPYLAQVIDYQRRFAAYKNPNVPAYDALLDDYEEGMSMETLDAFFAMLKSELVPLIEGVKEQPPLPAFASAYCSVDAQRKLAHRLMDVMCIDPERCILAETEHPFTTGFHNHDVRITTHYYENDVLSSLYSVIHEGGHALYELGIPDAFQQTCLADCASIGLHESQSRFYENMVGHSAGFLRFLAPILRELFPDATKGMDERALYRAANRVTPSLIRTEADEVTYSLHIMVRYELEKQLIGGTLSTKDLPEAWNKLYKDVLGVTVPDDSRGVLQDMHWGGGMFGYFPTYALGSAYAAQLMAAIRRELPVDELLERGELAPIGAWLTEHVHKYGKLLHPAKLLEAATGEGFNPAYYVEHLKQKIKEGYDA